MSGRPTREIGLAVAYLQRTPGCTPQQADEFLTGTLQTALAQVDVRVLDHVVIGWPDVVSMADRGLM